MNELVGHANYIEYLLGRFKNKAGAEALWWPVVGVPAGWLGLLQRKKLTFDFIYSGGCLGKHIVSKSPTFIHRREPERVLPGGSVSGSC